MKNIRKNKTVIYQAKNGAIELRGDFDNDNTVLGSLNQMADLFGRDKSVISRHIKNIFKSGELNKRATVAKIATVQKEGKREIMREVEYYNLDMILSVGYRVDSKIAIEFRRWSTKILKQHITKGYTINRKIIGKNYDQFIKAVDDVKKLLPKGNIISRSDILELVKSFSNAWLSLESHDEDSFPKVGGY